MNTPMIHRRNILHAHRRAFTLVELLVAVGVISFLIVGIGQIFRSVGALVSTGTAVAEVQQMARAIERQLRDDFAALSDMNTEDTFIAIRMREIGDLNRNEMLDGVEKAVYLTQEDRDADIRDIADGVIMGPYEPGSRAVTVRLDEIMFLAAAPVGGTYTSFEQDRFGRMDATAPVARIYYGHALRPPRDPNWPSDEDGAPRVPQRIFIPDGDFAEGVPDSGSSSEQNRFVTVLGGGLYAQAGDFNNATGRNEYAARWLLGRQALLLAGGEAAGNADSPLGATIFQNEREYAPFIRDLESIDRFWRSGGGGGLGFYNLSLDHQGARSGRIVESSGIYDPPGMRLIHHGRTDMTAQNLEDVKGWLEGEPWPQFGSAPPPLRDQQSAPFSGGRFGLGAFRDAYRDVLTLGIDFPAFGDLAATTFTETVRGMLWQQPNPDPSALSEGDAYFLTRRGVRAAIAGAFTRIIADEEPPFFDRVRDTANINYEIDNFDEPSDPEDVFMDAHTILAERCSNFEIAWRFAEPDWPVANEDIDIDGDGAFDFRVGDRIWFDITMLNPPDQNTRSTLQNWLNRNSLSNFIGQPPAFGDIPPNTSNNVPFKGANGSQQPEVGHADFRNPPSGPFGVFDRYFTDAGPDNGTIVSGSATRHPDAGASLPQGYPPAYNPDITGGAPAGVPEYLAIWPFRTPSLSGGFTGEAFPKKLQIRVRMTLHDSQNRIQGGRTFEYVFDVSPRQ